MECLAQYLDDLEDLFFAAALAGERLRRAVKALIVAGLTLSGLALGIVLALRQPPIALAVVSLLIVTLLYRATVSEPRRPIAET